MNPTELPPFPPLLYTKERGGSRLLYELLAWLRHHLPHRFFSIFLLHYTPASPLFFLLPSGTEEI